jgi:hypothetical protein
MNGNSEPKTSIQNDLENMKFPYLINSNPIQIAANQ